MRSTTAIFVNGQRVDPDSLTGVETAPDIRHREDMGIYLGRAHPSLGALRGDIAEVAVFMVAITSASSRFSSLFNGRSGNLGGPASIPRSVNPCLMH